jgi:hypothetical protein
MCARNPHSTVRRSIARRMDTPVTTWKPTLPGTVRSPSYNVIMGKFYTGKWPLSMGECAVHTNYPCYLKGIINPDDASHRAVPKKDLLALLCRIMVPLSGHTPRPLYNALAHRGYKSSLGVFQCWWTGRNPGGTDVPQGTGPRCQGVLIVSSISLWSSP